MNLAKRIKRHIIGRAHELFAVTLPGHEQLCANEIEAASDTLHVTEVLNGGVCFNGRLTDLYLANLHTRTAGRILLRLGRFKATNFNQLATRCRKIAWELYLKPGTLPEINVTAHHSRLYHTQAVAEHIDGSMAARWSELGVAPSRVKDQTLFVRLQDDRVTLSLDSSGASLYQRGLKTHIAHAPLRETMAAAILITAGFRPDRPLVDPMCGSGTFSLEAALMAKNIPPGFFREYSFMHWPAFRPQQWAHLKKTAGQKVHRQDTPMIWASDSDETACARLDGCVERNDLKDAVTVSHNNFFNIQPKKLTATTGLIVLNPPYGQRLPGQGDVKKQYREICAKLKKDFKGWRAALLVPKTVSTQPLGLSLKPLRMDHGGLQLTLLVGTI